MNPLLDHNPRALDHCPGAFRPIEPGLKQSSRSVRPLGNSGQPVNTTTSARLLRALRQGKKSVSSDEAALFVGDPDESIPWLAFAVG
jgi:hypothetical protein